MGTPVPRLDVYRALERQSSFIDPILILVSPREPLVCISRSLIELDCSEKGLLSPVILAGEFIKLSERYKRRRFPWTEGDCSIAGRLGTFEIGRVIRGVEALSICVTESCICVRVVRVQLNSLFKICFGRLKRFAGYRHPQEALAPQVRFEGIDTICALLGNDTFRLVGDY